MKKIVFIGDYRFPSSYAACNRVYYMAKACRRIGYETLVVGKGRLEDKTKDVNVYKGVPYTSMEKSSVSTIVKLLTFFKRRRMYPEALKQYAGDAEYVVAYGCSCAKHMKKILKFGRENNVKIICDISEWYDRKQFSGLRGFVEYSIFSRAFKNTFKKADKIICCSQLVKDYFSGKNDNILVLNGIIDTDEYKPCLHLDTKKWELIYSGIPGTKDHLIEFYEAFDSMQIKDECVLNIVGPTEEYMDRLLRELGYTRQKPGSINIVPRVDKDTLAEMIKKSNFSVLLRPNERYANAGFPSKLYESLSLGTPMITNITSDIGNYLSEENSVIIKDLSIDSVVDAIKRAINIEQKEYDSMRKKCVDISKESFSLATAANKLKGFLADQAD